MKKAKLIGIVIIAVIIWLAIILLPPYISGQKNYKLMKEYIEDKHGDDYVIVDKSLGSVGASGRQNDYVRVEQHGITYYVYALDGEIIEDTYNNNYAGKIVCEYIIEQLKEDGVELPDFDNRSIVINGLFTADNIPDSVKTYEDAKQLNSTVNITITIEDTLDYKKEKWLYDFFCVLKSEFQEFVFFVSVGTDFSNEGNFYSMDYQSVYGEDIENIDDFWSRFR